MTKKSGYNIISVDLGGTKILTSWVNSGGEILARVKLPTKAESGKNSVAKRIAESITQLLKENTLTEKDIKAVCVGVPGSVNPYTGIIGIAPNLGVKNYNIKAELEKFINIPVFIENDVNLGALGIQRFELTEKSLNTLVMFIGTGIGGALIL
ncbi:MAG TPA: ROK family protein, partial [Ignavibacteriales bacterium]|nr:ROK family protein [Ignavibacteriales bacterium]